MSDARYVEQGASASLDEALSATVRRTGASAGGVYLASASEPVLGLIAVCGVPVMAVAPWRRVAVSRPSPLSAAVREDRLVWVGCQEDLARLYPNSAAGTPYRFAVAVAPLRGVRLHGAMVLVWSPSHPVSLTQRERGTIRSSARRLTQILDEAPSAWSIPEQPRAVPLRRSALDPDQSAVAAADLLQRLPVGALSLDLEGRITCLNDAAARLLGSEADRLVGTLPWQAVPWLDATAHEEHYRTAVLSRDPVAFTAVRPSGEELDVRLYPNDSGISVLISPLGAGQPASAPLPRAGAPVPAPPGAGTGRIHQMIHLSAALSQTVTVADIVKVVADQVLPAFGAQGMVLSTVEAGRLRITGHRGYDARTVARLDGLALDTVLTPVGRVLETGTPAFIPDLTEMARSYPEAHGVSGKQAWAFLPLVVSDRRVGCCVLSYDRPHHFSAPDRAVLVSLGGLIAQAVDRALLYDAKHDLAHGLQRALLPVALPRIPGLTVAARYLPAAHGMDIGGDFYDVIRLSDTTAAAVIGDVQGHNITAAALMGQVRTAVHATADPRPGAVLARTNRLLADLETDLFVSCLYIVMDLAGRRLHLASAGHPPPLLRSPSSESTTRVLEVEPGPLLGIGPNTAADYPVTRAPLPGGSLLALYTDGLVETRDTDITQSITALAHRLDTGGDQPLDDLADSLVDQAGPLGTHTDDLALLLLRTR